MIYVDSSALTKLVLDEAESIAFHTYAQGRAIVSSALSRTEVLRAVIRVDAARLGKAMGLLDELDLLAIVETILDSAARLAPPHLRSLDAIHLASALTLGNELEAFVAYDERLLSAASSLGMPIESPGVRR